MINRSKLIVWIKFPEARENYISPLGVKEINTIIEKEMHDTSLNNVFSGQNTDPFSGFVLFVGSKSRLSYQLHGDYSKNEEFGCKIDLLYLAPNFARWVIFSFYTMGLFFVFLSKEPLIFLLLAIPAILLHGFLYLVFKLSKFRAKKRIIDLLNLRE